MATTYSIAINENVVGDWWEEGALGRLFPDKQQASSTSAIRPSD
jgi:hypothetical protein